MSRHIQTQTEWEATMARRIMDQLRGELYLDQRYLNAALGALPPAPLPPDTTGHAFATDGARLCYPETWVLATYRKNRRYLPRAYLHSVLHCIFRHLWLRGDRDRTLWGLACDIAVENTLDSLNTPATTRPVGWLRQQAYQQLQQQCGLLAAGPIYRALRETDDETLTKWLREFPCDDHRFWPADPDSPQAQLQGKQWEQLGRQTQLSMEESGQHAGENAGARALQAQVQASRSRRSYRDFLRRFAVLREEPHLDPDSFDLGFYSYGLQVYGNMPLLEPLETRESTKIHDLVIVLDTSQSTSGELVKGFLTETFTLLRSTGSFFSRCRLRILQCDDAVRQDTALQSPDELDAYLHSFTLLGGGGTDFRPAFCHVDRLVAAGQMALPRGLLYFTDGKGIFPEKPPKYNTAFLFLGEGPETPPWAMRLVLDSEEFAPAPPPSTPFWEDDWQPDEHIM